MFAEVNVDAVLGIDIGKADFHCVLLDEGRSFGGWALVKVPRDERDKYRALQRKFEHECRQLANVSQPRVILLDATGLTPDILSGTAQARLNETIGQSLLSRPKVAMLWIATRGWTDRQRFQYHAVTMNNPSSEKPVPEAFMDHATDEEWRRDFLTGQLI